MTSFLYYNGTVVITFYTLILNTIPTIFHFIVNDLYKSLLLGAKMHNTAHSPICTVE